jgi:tyrosine-protein kinase
MTTVGCALSRIRADLRPYLALLARRWTVIVPAIVLVPLVALLLAAHEPPVYSANAQVLLTYSSPGASLNGLASPYPGSSPDRNVATQAALARDPAVAQEALILSHVRSTPTDVLAESSVSSPTGADLLSFSVQDASPARAQTLATNYAQAYVNYRARIDNQAITTALAGVNQQIARLAAAGQRRSPAYQTLTRNQQALIATHASGTNDAVLAQPAQEAVEIGPHPARAAAVGLVVGIALAVALAFMMETLDQRVSVEEIERRLKLPLLASIPGPRRWTRSLRAMVNLSEGETQEGDADSLVVLRDPNGREAKAFRVLKSGLEFARMEHDFKTLLFTSTRQYDSQPETVANLAVTLAQAGNRVLLCDLTAKRPAVDDIFDLGDRPGVTEVILARIPLEDAIVPMDDPSLASPRARSTRIVSTNGGATALRSMPGRDLGGGLDILPFGAPPPNSGFLGTRAVTDFMEQLKLARYDLVLIDAPPLLVSGEAQTLSTLADAIIVALPHPVRLRMLVDLTATLSRLPVLALGFVTVGTGSSRAKVRSHDGAENGRTPAGEVPRPTLVVNGGSEQMPGPPSRKWVEQCRSSPRYVDELRDS